MRVRISAQIFMLGATTLWLVACGDDTMPNPSSATYEEAEMVLRASCAFGASCHGGPGQGQAMLNFQRAIEAGEPLTTELLMEGVPRPSCEYSQMPLIDPGNPDNSWLMIKIEGPHTDGQIDFVPEPEWDNGLVTNPDGSYPSSLCPLTQGGTLVFGGLMPLSIGAPAPLDSEAVSTLRSWINAGAPGPDLPAP